MIRKILLISAVLLAASFCYAQTSDQPAQPTDQYQQQPAAPQETTMVTIKHITGTVEKIDLKNKNFTIKDDVTDTSTVFTFNDATTFNKDDATIKAEDVKKGKRVALDVDTNNLITKFVIEPKATKPETKQ